LRRKAQQAEEDDDDAEGVTDVRAGEVDVEALAETYERFGQYDMSGDIITALSAEVRLPFPFIQATMPPAC
jgi:hypothetical protein